MTEQFPTSKSKCSQTFRVIAGENLEVGQSAYISKDDSKAYLADENSREHMAVMVGAIKGQPTMLCLAWKE